MRTPQFHHLNVDGTLVQVGVNNSGKSIALSRSVTGGLTNGSAGRPVSTRQVTDLARAIWFFGNVRGRPAAVSIRPETAPVYSTCAGLWTTEIPSEPFNLLKSAATRRRLRHLGRDAAPAPLGRRGQSAPPDYLALA